MSSEHRFRSRLESAKHEAPLAAMAALCPRWCDFVGPGYARCYIPFIDFALESTFYDPWFLLEVALRRR
jgi:hypothetical protein